MQLFPSRLAKRSTALVMLLVWMFALGSGVANACLLEAPGQHSFGTSGSGEHGHAPDVSVAHQHDAAGHGDDPGTAKESCLKACDDGSHTLLKAHAGLGHADPGTAPLVTTLWAASVPVAMAFSRIDGLQVPIVGPPFRVRYSRLAL